MKKSLKIFFAVCLVICLLIVPASRQLKAEEPPKVIVSSEEFTKGSGSCDVSISFKDITGIASAKLIVTYDEALTLQSVTYNEELGGVFMQPSKLSSPVTLNWVKLENVVGDAVYAVLKFTVDDSVSEGEYPISVSYSAGNVIDINEKNVDLSITNGKIEVKSPCAHPSLSDWIIDKNPTKSEAGSKHIECTVCHHIIQTEIIPDTHIAGDINDDGNIDNRDLVRLFQYLSDWDVVIF